MEFDLDEFNNVFSGLVDAIHHLVSALSSLFEKGSGLIHR